MINVIVGLALFMFGNLSGFFLRGFLEKRSLHMSEQSSKNFLIILITTTWVFAMIVDVSNPSYDVPLAVHGILGVIVGFFFAKPTKGGQDE